MSASSPSARSAPSARLPGPGSSHPDTVDDRAWQVVEERFDPANLRVAESLFSVGNGRFSTRGSFEEGHPGDQAATLMHGVYAPHPLAACELANLPDWTSLEIVADGERFGLADGTLVDYRRTLDLRAGLLTRTVTWRSPGGRTLDLTFERFASLADPGVAAVRASITPVDFAGPIEVRAGASAYADTEGRAHLAWEAQRVVSSGIALSVRVRDTDARVAMAVSLAVLGADVATETWDVRGQPTIVARWPASPGATVIVEKIVSLASSRVADDPLATVTARMAELAGTGFESLRDASAAAWRRDWDVSDVVIEGDREAQLATRFSLYHLMIAAPRNDEQASIGAKTLSGFGYRGHVFWDTETFMLPFFTHTQPSVARDLLSYRYHRLPAARRKARASGYDGAQVPWESAESGDEVTPTWLPDDADRGRLVRIWTGDIEIHVSADVAHAVMSYWQATGDDRFMVDRGAEIMIETGRFWASRAEWSAETGRYGYSDVIGPDEYHDHVDDNAFTNYLAAWNLRAAADVAEWLAGADPERARSIGAEPATVARFRAVADLVHLPRDPESGLVEQFRGYFDRRDVDLSDYAGRAASLQSILGIEGVAETQVIKQPDVLMLAYLLPDALSREDLAANYAYYEPRTDHAYGSSLGPAIQALMAARMGRVDDAYAHFMRAARADLRDVRGNASDGIHGASAGGLWQALVFGFGGISFDGDRVIAEPRLPSGWTRLAFRLAHRGRIVDVDLRAPEAVPELPTGLRRGIRGLIFDLGGVITDTAGLHLRAWQRVADEAGLPRDRGPQAGRADATRPESLRTLLGEHSITDAEAEALMHRTHAYFRESLTALTPADVLPGALEVLDAARARGLSVALESTSREAREVVDRLEIAARFDVICDGHTVEAAKPAPDVFLAASAAMGLAPSACVVFEDAAEGVAAARAAGMLVVGIGPADRVGSAHIVLPGLADADIDAILAAVESSEAA